MSHLAGAWSLSGTPISNPDRSAMRRALPSGGREIERGPLWMCASNSLDDRRTCLGAEGFFVEAGLESAFKYPDTSDVPEGQFVFACADLDRRTLFLVRSPSGGERLYYAVVDDLLLFAASVRAILAHPRVRAKLNIDVLDQVLFTGMPLFGSESLIEGIDEVLPGHVLTQSPEGRRHHSWLDKYLVSPEGPPDRLAREFRNTLARGIEKSIGRQRPVALALSGGIDSSAIAASAVDVVGADNIHAFTYEFDDPTHSKETEYAQEVARTLGIRRHEIFKIPLSGFLDAIPETVWHSERITDWPKAFLLPVARTIRDRGYGQYLTGFGIGSHMSYLQDLASILPWIPGWLLKYWKKERFDRWDPLGELERIHPGLEPPHPRLYYFLVRTLEREGLIKDASRFFPAEVAPLLRLGRAGSDGECATGPLASRLQRGAFSHMISCIDVTRSEKTTREATGIYRISPAHFASCIPYAYFPIQPNLPLWSATRGLRPGKYLLRKAYRRVLPDSVLFRVKSWGDAVATPEWLRQGRVKMMATVPGFPKKFLSLGKEVIDAIQFWEPESIQATGLALSFWERLFINRPVCNHPPTWEELITREASTSIGRMHRSSGLVRGT